MFNFVHITSHIKTCYKVCMNTYTHVPDTQHAHKLHKPDCHSLICSLNIYLCRQLYSDGMSQSYTVCTQHTLYYSTCTNSHNTNTCINIAIQCINARNIDWRKRRRVGNIQRRYSNTWTVRNRKPYPRMQINITHLILPSV